MTEFDASTLLPVAQAAVALGSKRLSSAGAGLVRRKSDRDYVTSLDLMIEDEIRSYLADATPHIEFLGEETYASEFDPGSVELLWTLDPIDGTSNFVHGIPLCAVSLALMRHGRPIVAAVSAPFLGLDYYAADGLGAFEKGRRLAANQTASLEEAIVSIGDYAVGEGADRKNHQRIAITAALAASVERVRMFGSAAVDLAWVAEGRTDACIIMSNKPWDMAAGVLLARESGALVIDSHGQQHSLSAHDTIATSAQLAGPLLVLLNDIDIRATTDDQIS